MNEFYELGKGELVSDSEALSVMLDCGPKEREAVRLVSRTYKMRVTSYYAGLIDRKDPQCPLRRQCIPDIRELEQDPLLEDDPLEEGVFSPVPFLIHKYRDRALFLASPQCFVYCRHCTRKNTAINSRVPSETEFQAVLDYLRKADGIRDVLISGGDPLTLSDELLEHYIEGIRGVSHIETIRIGTRAIVTCPVRITEKLADMLSKYHPVWVNTQFNHPREITAEAAQACSLLLSRGIPLGNQSVLMKGINDDIDTMEKLVTGLVRIRVRPYYLYQADNVKGTNAFYTPYTKGLMMMEELRRRVSGYAVPRFIIDVPGPNGGKVTAEENHIIEAGSDYLLMTGREEGTQAVYRFHPEQDRSIR